MMLTGETKGLTASSPSGTDNKLRRTPGVGKAPHPDDVDTPRAAVPRLLLASLLFAVALVLANGPFPLTAVLPGVPAVPAPLHPAGLGDGE